MDNVNIGIRHDQSLDSQDDNVGLSNDGLNNRNGDDAQNNRKRKRRSKNDQDGRNFKCSYCGKSYLSQPALTSHVKSKHKQNDPDFLRRGRGRPRKNPFNPNICDKEPLKFKTFFEKDPRKRNPQDENNDIMLLCSDAFTHLLNNYKTNKILLNINSIEDHNLYRKINELYIRTTKDIENADETFAKYIIETFSLCNKEYFLFVVKFAVLFRECINRFKTPSDSSTEFTTTENAESVPDLCNEFITDFMENNDYFGLDTNELIEIIQQFCNWLYENKYTTSRLTLLN